MKKLNIISIFTVLLLVISSNCFAHFGMVIPSDSMVMQGDARDLSLILSFSHPFEMSGMDMEKPVKFEMILKDKKTDLLSSLKETKVMDRKAWKAFYRVKRPGVYWFHMEPKPYWEPAEDCYIIHYTKTIIAAFGEDAGWDEPIGLKTEIVPLTRPFGLYAGNAFQGIVLVDGKPAPGTEVEVEYYNKDKKSEAPNDYFVTQVVKADNNGVFTFAAPKAGWWGFAGLNTSDKKIKHNGEDKDIEIGAVLWIEFKDMK
jgi:cobalt/nickel transport protein